MRTQKELKDQEVKDGVSVLRQFRCTRNEPYPCNCPGHEDTSSRQGYYITAGSVAEAKHMMQLRFPEDVKGFTSELWHETVRAFED